MFFLIIAMLILIIETLSQYDIVSYKCKKNSCNCDHICHNYNLTTCKKKKKKKKIIS